MRLEQIRNKKNLTQTQLSKLSGVAQSTISDIEHGNISPTVGTLYKLARVLEVTVADLLREKGPERDTGTEG